MKRYSLLFSGLLLAVLLAVSCSSTPEAEGPAATDGMVAAVPAPNDELQKAEGLKQAIDQYGLSGYLPDEYKKADEELLAGKNAMGNDNMRAKAQLDSAAGRYQKVIDTAVEEITKNRKKELQAAKDKADDKKDDAKDDAKDDGKDKGDEKDNVGKESKKGGKGGKGGASKEEIDELEKKAKAAKDKEQSSANKMLGGLTIAATGIGGMQLAQGLSEMKSDKEAAADMKAYLDTIVCGIGGAKSLGYNNAGMTPEDTRQLVDARLRYASLAQKIKRAKEMLGMPPGIESELIADIAGLYSGRGTDVNGISHHFDTATERLDSKSGQKRAMIGGVVAAAGVIGGVVGNAAINGDGALAEKIKGAGGKSDEIDKKARESKLPSSVVSAVYNKIYNLNDAGHIINEMKDQKDFMAMTERDQLAYVESRAFKDRYRQYLADAE